MPESHNHRFYLGIDVGTGSVRAGIFDGSGRLLSVASHAIETRRPQDDFVEQSSEDIWQACGAAVRSAVAQAGIEPGQIGGMGFDATCSLVVLDAEERSVTVDPDGDDRWNVIVWMDHRAIEQASRINHTSHDVLNYVGGTISPEMQSPKLLWIKENLPATWNRAAHYFDLPDFLTFRATGDQTRSLCTTVCKWTYMGHEEANIPGSAGRWEDSYWNAIGLGDLVEGGYSRIGRRVRPMGEALGSGLTAQAARDLGLSAGIPVGVSIIDAHAGGLGSLGAQLDGMATTSEQMESRLALIAGTSSCHMAVARTSWFLPGIWGPYFSAMIPGMWLHEGGQSATGALIDHVIQSHARSAALQEETRSTGRSVYEQLNGRLDALAKQVDAPAFLTRDLHCLPYFHGNRSPRADPTLRGMISGLRLADSADDLAVLYLATIQAIAHGTRHIISTMNAAGYQIRTIFASGGGIRNPVFLREHADITGCQIILPREPEAVLLGSAILGAVASGDHVSLWEAMGAMNHTGEIIFPSGGAVARFHEAKHTIFQRMYADQMAYRSLLEF
ncbi:FGGY-family carbohydrate kinase [Candidatus Neomarinimicrobiota bacterium]